MVCCKAVGRSVTDDDKADNALLDLDAVSVTEMDSVVYKRLLGRWRREAIAALQSKFFWVQLIIAAWPLLPHS